MPRGKQRVRMLRSVVTAGGESYEVEGVYDLAARLAASWCAYGVCEDAAGAELRSGVADMESDEVDADGEPARLVRSDGRVEA